MTDTTDNRGATADKLAQLALDMTEHPGDAVTALMRASALILDRTFGGDETARLMHEMTGEALRAWETAKAAAGSGSTH